ncbi:hypothetical protein BaRGS_00000604, partial [Batillaria attramentaria]
MRSCLPASGFSQYQAVRPAKSLAVLKVLSLNRGVPVVGTCGTEKQCGPPQHQQAWGGGRLFSPGFRERHTRCPSLTCNGLLVSVADRQHTKTYLSGLPAANLSSEKVEAGSADCVY